MMEDSLEDTEGGFEDFKNRGIFRATIRFWNLTPGQISGENSNSKRYMYPSVHCSTVYNSQDMEAT